MSNRIYWRMGWGRLIWWGDQQGREALSISGQIQFGRIWKKINRSKVPKMREVIYVGWMETIKWNFLAKIEFLSYRYWICPWFLSLKCQKTRLFFIKVFQKSKNSFPKKPFGSLRFLFAFRSVRYNRRWFCSFRTKFSEENEQQWMNGLLECPVED